MAGFTEKTVLVADIGGTNSRFGLFFCNSAAVTCDDGLKLVRTVRFPTTGSRSTADMMRLLVETPGDDGGFFTPLSPFPVRVDAAVFAVPALVPSTSPTPFAPKDDVLHCPNMAWPIETAAVAAALGHAPVRFINDFVANGYACALLPQRIDAVTVLAGEEQPDFPRAVVGAGTGLGHCLILPTTSPMVIGSEGGQALFPFMGEEEWALARFMAEKRGTTQSNGDMALGGSALAHMYAFYTGAIVPPNVASTLAAKNPSVLAMAARLYGRAVRQYVMNTLAFGGVFITGGLAANLPQVLLHPSFATELREGGAMSRLLETLPVRHVRNGDTGLWGAAVYATYTTW